MKKSNVTSQGLSLFQVAEVKVSYQSIGLLSDRPKINNSKDAENNVFRANWSDN
jgi:hypothetical protein